MAIHPHADETRSTDFIPNTLVLLLPAPFYGRHHIIFRPLRQAADLIDNFVRGLRADRDIAVRTIRLSQPRVKNPKIVIDLCYSADGGPRALARCLLFN